MRDKVEIAVKTDTGMVRSENQDHFSVFQAEGSEEECVKGAFVIVADGMGGHTGGTVASRTATDAMMQTFRDSSLTSMHDLLEESIISGNNAVIAKQESNPQIQDMGTTCVSTLVRGKFAMVAHLGDSRCYLFRDGTSEIVTRDHTYLNELIDIGLLTPEQAEGHPDKNIITRCVGMSPKLEIDFNRREIRPGDVLLMCSDGLSNFVKTDEMREAAQTYSAEDACQRLIDLANERGGDDNITVAIIKIHEPPAEDAELARLDAEQAQYSSKMTPVINRDELDVELVAGDTVADAEADTAEGTQRPAVPSDDGGAGRQQREANVPEDEVPTLRNAVVEEPRPRPRGQWVWYWLIGAEIVVLFLLQFWIARF